MKNLPQISEAEFEVMKIVWKYAPINTNEITELKFREKAYGWRNQELYTKTSHT